MPFEIDSPLVTVSAESMISRHLPRTVWCACTISGSTKRVRARLEVVWFENGDFSLHYHEEHDTSEFDHRWDRHPSGHNTRDHVHPGPDAPTPGDDSPHPIDWRDVLSMVLSEIEERQRAFWESRTFVEIGDYATVSILSLRRRCLRNGRPGQIPGRYNLVIEGAYETFEHQIPVEEFVQRLKEDDVPDLVSVVGLSEALAEEDLANELAHEMDRRANDLEYQSPTVQFVVEGSFHRSGKTYDLR